METGTARAGAYARTRRSLPLWRPSPLAQEPGAEMPTPPATEPMLPMPWLRRGGKRDHRDEDGGQLVYTSAQQRRWWARSRSLPIALLEIHVFSFLLPPGSWRRKRRTSASRRTLLVQGRGHTEKGLHVQKRWIASEAPIPSLASEFSGSERH
jgi:hypothetical protein